MTTKTSAASRTVGLFESSEPKQFALFSGSFAPKEQTPLFVGKECQNTRLPSLKSLEDAGKGTDR